VTTSAPVIEVENVSKWFRDLVALSDVSLSIGPGVTALLGPNGAGKSTLMRILYGLTPPSRGQVRVLGRVPRADENLWQHMSLVPQQEALPEQLYAHEFVAAVAQMQRVSNAPAAATEKLDLVELDPRDRRPLKTYSKGMRQRVKVAAALVHDPQIIVLDEPLNGLDPSQRLRMIDLFRRLGAEGKCVLVSSHILEEVERIGSRIVVIAEGRLAAEGEFQQIRELMDDRPHRLRLRTDRPRELAAALVGNGVVSGISVETDDSVIIDTSSVQDFRRSIANLAVEQRARLLELAPLDDDLDSVFRYLIERRTL
jgi:ABC-2 type transport system ATP-binding protein